LKNGGKHICISSSTGTGKTLSLLCSLLSMGYKRIIFCSRTHKQLNNVHKDLKLTSYADQFSILTLGSRNELHNSECSCYITKT